MVSNKISIENIDSTNFAKVIEFAKQKNIYFTIVGPEVELSLGIVDAFEEHGLKIFGPNKYVAQLESSKSFCKQKMNEFNIPTANYEKFNNVENANKYVQNLSFPIVIKADGLAAGKGVSILSNLSDAQTVIKQYLEDKKFGSASKEIIVEEYLEGPEFSQLAFVNDDKISFMKIAQDYKRAYDNDEGENTGGMGCHMPVDLNEETINEGKKIIKKMVLGMRKNGNPFKGILYAGLMRTKNGVKVIEFNVRFGDPETELILSAMKTDLFLVIDNLFDKKIIKIE
jgi:phosphoribosylamine--glycine ligase